MAISPWVGWTVTALASLLLNKSSSSTDSDSDPQELTISETSTGTPIPVVMGRTLLKNPLVIYYGDFRSEIYTETYAAHSSFSAWPIILEALAIWATEPVTGKVQGTHTHKAPNGTTGPNTPSTLPTKEVKGPSYLMLAVQWLLSWLINARNLKTTMQKGFKYYLGYQMLWAWSGEGARVRAIYMDKYNSGTGKTAKGVVWEGDEVRENHTPNAFVIRIDDDELFGGPDEQGGFVGEFHVYLGGPDQIADPWMIEQMKADSIQEELRGLTPAYRPYLSTVVPTAYVGKSATVPSTWLDYQWIPNRLGLGAIGEDANPAEVIYEIYVNEEWGMNESPNTLNVDSLIAMGETLKKEGMGITVTLTAISKGETVIDTILEHINGVRYQEPITGKWTYKLIRDDYDTSTITLIDESNISSISYKRLDWQETIGVVSVTYSDRKAQYEESSLQANDPAVIEINENSKTTKSYDYKYFTIAENALWVAKREGMQQGYPLATASVTGNRTLSSVRIGDVVLLNFSPYGLSNMVFRVTDVDIGTFTDGKVKLELIEDVFSLGKTIFGYSGSTGWNTEKKTPTGVNEYQFIELPYELMPDKDSYVFAMAAKPDKDTVKWTTWRNYNGTWAATSSMTKWTPTGRLMYDYDEFTDAIDMVGIEIKDISGLDQLRAAMLAGGIPDVESARRGSKCIFVGGEIMAWSSIERLPNGNYILKGIIRGAYDTIPQAHGAGEDVFFFDSSYCSNVTTGGPVCKAGNTTTEYYTITTASVDKAEDFNTLKMKELTTRRRSERPSPPGRVRMSSFMQNDKVSLQNIAGDILLTWVNRNKDLQSFGVASQDDEKEYWTGLDYDLPANASYLVRVIVDGSVVATFLTTECSFAYSWAQRCKDSKDIESETVLQLTTIKDGLESYQPQTRRFLWKPPVMIDACLTEEDIRSRLAEWASITQIVIPENDYTIQRKVIYSEMAIFILGDLTTAETKGAVLNYDGKYILPNGQIAVVTNQNSYSIITADPGYMFRAFFMPEQSGGDKIYTLGG